MSAPPFPGDEMQLDLLTAVARLQQIADLGGFYGPDDGSDVLVECLADRVLECDLPRLRRYLTPAVVAWAEREEAL